MTLEEARAALARELQMTPDSEWLDRWLVRNREALLVALGGKRQFIDLGTVPVWVVPDE